MRIERKLSALILLSLVAVTAGCGSSHTDEPCGPGARLVQQGTAVYCAYGVIVGGFRCPDAVPYEVPGFRQVCANRPNAVPDSFVCAALELTCGLRNDGGSDAGGDAGGDAAADGGGSIVPCLAAVQASTTTVRADAQRAMRGQRCATEGMTCGPICGGGGFMCTRGTWTDLNTACADSNPTFSCGQGACRTNQYCSRDCAGPDVCAPLPAACSGGSDCHCLDANCNDPNRQDISYSGRVSATGTEPTGIEINVCA